MKFNVFDLLLVMIGAADAIAFMTKRELSIVNPGFLRFFRIFRVAKKLFRVIRLLQFFSELRIMARCVLGSGLALFWSFMLLCGFTLVFSILVVQQFTLFLSDNYTDLDSSYMSKVQTHFGSVRQTVLSLFMGISGGADWGDLYDIVVLTGWLNSSLFLVYILMVWMSITNIIISIFVDRAMKLAQPDMDALLLAKRKSDLLHVQDLKSVFAAMDENHSGTLSAEELRRCIQDVRMASVFEMKGLDIKDAEVFFSMLTSMSGTDEVDVHTFLTGWLKLKGPATSLDLYTLQFQQQLWENTMANDLSQCRQDVARLHQDFMHSERATREGSVEYPAEDDRESTSESMVMV